jgi:O-antigen ligase
MYDPSVLNLNQMIRFEYPLDHPNTAGYLFSMGIPLTLVVFINEKGWLRALGGFSLMAQFGGLILTYSRGAWLGCFASLFFLALIQKNLRKILVIVGIIVFILVVAISPLQSRLWSLAKEMGHPDILWRFQVMINAISLGVENPLLGVGYAGDHFRAALQERYPEFSNQRYVHHSHNVYTEILAGTGFLGLGAFLWLLGSTLVRLLQKGRSELVEEKRLLYFCLFASLLAFIITGLGDVPFYHHETRLYFFNLLALIYIHLRAARPL